MPRIARWFEIDVRALAAMRIGLGLLILWDLADRARHLIEFYTDSGACPRALYSSGGARFQSIYFLNESTTFVAAIFALHAIFAVMLLLGYRTRLATILCLFMTWSLTARNLVVCTGGDNVLVWLLVWSIFLPTGAVMSLDARRSNDPSRPRSISSIATAALLLQVVLIYASAAAAKTNAPWMRELSAVHYFLNSQIGTPLGHALGRFPVVTSALTALALLLEILGPLLALISAPIPGLRAMIAIIFILFHLALGATLYVGTFAIACALAWIPFLPPPVWDWLARITQLGANSDRPAPDPHWRAPGKIRGAIVVALLAYVALINVLTMLPSRLASFAGPLARLPRLRQNWTVMGTPPTVATHLSADAILADGQQIALIDSASPPACGLLDYIWPRGDARVLKFQTTMLDQATFGSLDAPQAYCAHAVRCWNAAHAPSQRAMEIKL